MVIIATWHVCSYIWVTSTTTTMHCFHSALYCQSQASRDFLAAVSSRGHHMQWHMYCSLLYTLTIDGKVVPYDLCFDSNITVETTLLKQQSHDLPAAVSCVSQWHNHVIDASHAHDYTYCNWGDQIWLKQLGCFCSVTIEESLLLSEQFYCCSPQCNTKSML